MIAAILDTIIALGLFTIAVLLCFGAWVLLGRSIAARAATSWTAAASARTGIEPAP
jgi:hypothetical protein